MLVIRVRKGGRVPPSRVLLATGINGEGYGEILGLSIGESESQDAWWEFFGQLKTRGLGGVDFVVSDDHEGVVKAAESHFQGASWQRC